MSRPLSCLLLTAALLACPRPVAAHPTPFSYLDLHLNANGVAGALVVHVYDVAHELDVASPDSLLEPGEVSRRRNALIGLLSGRLSVLFDDRVAVIRWETVEAVPERHSVRLSFKVQGERPARIRVRASFFPYDPAHQTFLNVYEEGALTHQAVVDIRRETADYYSGIMQGRLAVIRTFVSSGIEHILIGPDHVLFLVGLLLLGGSMARLALIVTAFTVGHSITLSVAALDILSPPARLVEPLIALTIVMVGADNLLVLRGSAGSTQSAADIRGWLAAGFGLVHGFGFAAVLKEFGLPQAALGWSLFAFNLGVEVGQLLIVITVAGLLALLARRSRVWTSRVARGGSIAVILAGMYWFVERTFFKGGL